MDYWERNHIDDQEIMPLIVKFDEESDDDSISDDEEDDDL